MPPYVMVDCFLGKVTIMRKRTKIKRTFLSSLFIQAFFFAISEALGPLPVVRSLFDIVAEQI
jgi:hypothetical protein